MSKITVADIKAASEELNAWAEDYAKAHDLGKADSRSPIEGSAIADALLTRIGLEDPELTGYIDEMTREAIARFVVRAVLGPRAGMTRYIAAEFGSFWMTGFSLGLEIGRKNPE